MPLFSKNPVDKKQIEAAIYRVERETSAELRVYIERQVPKDSDKNGYNRAVEIFYQLEMDKTEQQNAVLIYLAYKAHICQIIGDKGIHQYVGDAFWCSVCDSMIEMFKNNRYTEGIIQGVERIGKELSVHFPILPNDKDELSNEVIVNDE